MYLIIGLMSGEYYFFISYFAGSLAFLERYGTMLN